MKIEERSMQEFYGKITHRKTLLTVGKIYPEWQTKQDGFRLEWGRRGLYPLCHA